MCLELVPDAHKINADETSFRELGRSTKTFIWTFVTDDTIVYRYADSRSGSAHQG